MNPQFASLIERVIIPALLERFLAEHGLIPEPRAVSCSTTAASRVESRPSA